ncbi:MAG: hypothetical protein A3E83_05960 [Gammaproteobacteria bacterium RIFCSPHIGHO2_12_FULL_41_20]|nr:MAG: hypothetical protein A3E83_05960 [Gammaproteobacteria bacterium RIFCSPHIGHO2_12_FULL_41_20]
MLAGWYKIHNHHIILQLKIQPNAQRTAFQEILGSLRKIAIKAPPRDGEANVELIRFIAKVFKVPQKEVHIIRGLTSRIKTVRVCLQFNPQCEKGGDQGKMCGNLRRILNIVGKDFGIS